VLAPKSLPHAVCTEAVGSLPIMATTVVKQKDAVTVRVQDLHEVDAIFELQDHVVVGPAPIGIDTVIKFSNKR
jgi:hypothetical protein